MERANLLRYLHAAVSTAKKASPHSASSAEQAVQHARAALQFAFGAKNEFLDSLDQALLHAQRDRLRSKDRITEIRQESEFNQRRIGAAVGQLEAAVSAMTHGWQPPESGRDETPAVVRAQLLCPHCGHNTWQRSVHAFNVSEIVETADGTPFGIELFYELRACEMCDHALLYNGIVHNDDPGSLVYPADAMLPRGVSARVKKAYEAAKQIKKSSPSAFSGQVRKAFEFACKDKGAVGANLEQLIESMIRSGHLPQEMGKLGHVIRLVGNQGMHDEEDVTYEEAEILDELFLFALNYMYGFNEKLEVFDKELAEIEAKRSRERVKGAKRAASGEQ